MKQTTHVTAASDKDTLSKRMALAVVHGVRATVTAWWADVAFIYWQIRLPVRRQPHPIVDYFDQLSINQKSFYILTHGKRSIHTVTVNTCKQQYIDILST